LKGFLSLQDLMRRTRKHRQIWDPVPRSSKIIFLAMVFCLFAGVGVIGQLQASSASLPKIWTAAVLTGLFAVAYAAVCIERTWLLVFLVFPIQVVTMPFVFSFVKRHSAVAPTVPGAIRPWLESASMMGLFLLSGAYVLAMTFIAREGDRFFRTHAEVQLAGEIHKSISAGFHKRSGDYEFHGTSLASGVVGGDLVDVLERDGHWLAYVADVAGHGVSSGVLMAMIKSAASINMRSDPGSESLLAGINDVLCSLNTGNTFATLGLLAFSPHHGPRYALAGHLPIMRCRGRQVEFLPAQDMPAGLFPNATFASIPVEVQAGDILVIVTDGLTEVENKRGEEIGIAAIADVLRRLNDRPLNEVADAMFNAATCYGPRNDDQSLLLVRRIR
jgi:hypothetical protein